MAESTLSLVRHRVVNDLSLVHALLGMAMRKTADAHATRLFQGSRARVRVVALFHAVAWRDGTEVTSPLNARSYFAEVVHEAERARATQGRIHVDLETNGIALSVADVVPAGLIVNELVTNALAHAFPDGRSGRVVVTLSPCSGERNVLLRVTDDGIGFSAEEIDSDGLGLPLVRLLAEQLSGELVSSSVVGSGTDVCLRFAGTRESQAWQTS